MVRKVISSFTLCLHTPSQYSGKLLSMLVTGSSLESFFHAGDEVATDDMYGAAESDVSVDGSPANPKEPASPIRV